jgi:hypothetical protein
LPLQLAPFAISAPFFFFPHGIFRGKHLILKSKRETFYFCTALVLLQTYLTIVIRATGSDAT